MAVIEFEDINWIRPPSTKLDLVWMFDGMRNKPFMFNVHFVPEDTLPPRRGAYAVVTDPEVVKSVRRRFRRELRKIVKMYGHVPQGLREKPFWWTPKNTKLVVEEV